MRYTPAAAALALLASVSSSITYSAPLENLDQRASALVARGEAAMQAGQIDVAIDAYESALTVEPGSVTVLIKLADATRAQGMQGKALHYYRMALASDPRNLAAIAGEGEALAEKGAVQKARRNLARLKGMCGVDCDATRRLSAAIDSGSKPRVVHADAIKPEPVVSEN